MKRDPKKMVAATVAVIEYLKAESERARQEEVTAVQPPAPPDRPQFQPAGSLWAASGRMEIMRYRNLMELRALPRGR